MDGRDQYLAAELHYPAFLGSQNVAYLGLQTVVFKSKEQNKGSIRADVGREVAREEGSLALVITPAGF